ncbi:MAG: hypothetical protein EOO43_02665 [Flavobacterium sp.]|nr:MAG: hypothetical protein EOO43_02665 [Flavobacterium sp.]
MKKIIYTLLCFHFFSYSFAQDPNVLMGLDDPAHGVKIKINFPGYTGDWARGFTVSDNNTDPYFGIGVLGNSLNGVTSFDRGWIGKNNFESYMNFLANGNVGIGTTTPEHLLHLKKTQPTLNFEKTGVLNWTMGNIAGNDFYIKADNALLSPFVIESGTGNTGIGTATPREKLSVNGKIRAHEVKVETANWPDYVFEDAYKPKTLAEIEKFIKVNKHLSEVPSAKEVEQNGVELGEMNKILLKKIEELTLHLIQKEKSIEDLIRRVEKLEKPK